MLREAFVLVVSEGADVFEGEGFSGKVSRWEDGDIRRPIPIIAWLLGEEKECISDTNEQKDDNGEHHKAIERGNNGRSTF